MHKTDNQTNVYTELIDHNTNEFLESENILLDENFADDNVLRRLEYDRPNVIYAYETQNEQAKNEIIDNGENNVTKSESNASSLAENLAEFAQKNHFCVPSEYSNNICLSIHENSTPECYQLNGYNSAFTKIYDNYLQYANPCYYPINMTTISNTKNDVTNKYLMNDINSNYIQSVPFVNNTQLMKNENCLLTNFRKENTFEISNAKIDHTSRQLMNELTVSEPFSFQRSFHQISYQHSNEVELQNMDANYSLSNKNYNHEQTFSMQYNLISNSTEQYYNYQGQNNHELNLFQPNHENIPSDASNNFNEVINGKGNFIRSNSSTTHLPSVASLFETSFKPNAKLYESFLSEQKCSKTGNSLRTNVLNDSTEADALNTSSNILHSKNHQSSQSQTDELKSTAKSTYIETNNENNKSKKASRKIYKRKNKANKSNNEDKETGKEPNEFESSISEQSNNKYSLSDDSDALVTKKKRGRPRKFCEKSDSTKQTNNISLNNDCVRYAFVNERNFYFQNDSYRNQLYIHSFNHQIPDNEYRNIAKTDSSKADFNKFTLETSNVNDGSNFINLNKTALVRINSEIKKQFITPNSLKNNSLEPLVSYKIENKNLNYDDFDPLDDAIVHSIIQPAKGESFNTSVIND